jgi:hypothetical protein
MHPGGSLLASALTAVALLGGCGSDYSDGETEGGGGAEAEGAGGSGRCVDSWNGASRDVRAQASLTHRGEGADVQVGTYTGRAFTATGETYDASGSSTSAEVAVAPGACVAVDLTGSGERETNWVMVHVRGATGTQPGWYFLDESGRHPLAKTPQPLGETVRAAIVGFGSEARLEPGS